MKKKGNTVNNKKERLREKRRVESAEGVERVKRTCVRERETKQRMNLKVTRTLAEIRDKETNKRR